MGRHRPVCGLSWPPDRRRRSARRPSCRSPTSKLFVAPRPHPPPNPLQPLWPAPVFPCLDHQSQAPRQRHYFAMPSKKCGHKVISAQCPECQSDVFHRRAAVDRLCWHRRQHGWECPQLLFSFAVRTEESNTCASLFGFTNEFKMETSIKKLLTAKNCADVGTKPVSASVPQQHCKFAGLVFY